MTAFVIVVAIVVVGMPLGEWAADAVASLAGGAE